MTRNQFSATNADAALNVNRLTLAFAKAAAYTQDDKNDNLVVSPYNAATALAMAASGAAQATRDQMSRVLFDGAGDAVTQGSTALADLNHTILAAQKGKTDLKTANGLWTNDAILTLDADYAAEVSKIFGAEISHEDFSNPNVVDKINAWAAQHTNGLIDNVIERLNPKDDAAVLASALYFKGEWTHKFDKAKTQERHFVQDDGHQTTTPTMKKSFQDGEVTYQQGADYEAVALTYGKLEYKEGKRPSMRLLLVRPADDAVSARDWLSAQAGGAAPAWLEPYRYTGAEGSVELPRMDIKQKHNLIPMLQEMGIRDAFNVKTADFSRFTDDHSKDFYIGKVSHDVVFKTDEEGSEAAAVTTIGMIRATSIRMTPRIDVKFDRSFVFALQDIETGTVLFIGAVNKPNNDMKPSVATKNNNAPSGM